MISSMSSPQSIPSSTDETMRPVNLRTDLHQLADLIELVFADSMDAGGRAAIREMRAMSRLGAGLSVLGRVNELTLGVNLGYVWVDKKKVVGNVSIYPANWHKSLGVAWIIANVGVHPDYRRRSIARRLMVASLDLIRQRGGDHAILQVNYDNAQAIALYEDLGFVRERAFTTWTRNNHAVPSRTAQQDNIFITRPRASDWQEEYDLIRHLRPATAGGVGWLKPLHESLFHRTILQRVLDWFSMNQLEHLIVRDTDNRLVSSLWLDNTFGSLRVNGYIFAHPQHIQNEAAALIHNVLRRFRTSNIVIEHPADDLAMNELLAQFNFRPHRTVWHMRLDY